MRAAALAAALLLVPAPAAAFFQETSGDTTLDLRGNVRWSSLANASLSEHAPPGLASQVTFLRLVGELHSGDWLRVEVHALQLVSGTAGRGTALPAVDVGFRPGERNRTAALTWHQVREPSAQAFLELDRANVRLSMKPFDLTVGRQAINLATAYLFTPNDFFAPFFAQSFFRIYKPGVDAARVDVELGQLTSVSLIGVLGYDQGERPAAGDPPRLADSSLIGRASTNLADWDLSILGGRVAKTDLVGWGVQGELFGWLGVRSEGHVTLESSPVLEVSVGLEHRFESSLHVRLEQFHHGAGATSPAGYGATLAAGTANLPYLGRHYTALSASYQLTPLITGDALLLYNWTDHSALTSAYVAWSILDEAELAATVSIPLGPRPSGPLTPTLRGGRLVLGGLESEFGFYPATVNVELRLFF